MDRNPNFKKTYAVLAFDILQNEKNTQIRQLRSVWMSNKNPEYQMV